jgi:hypothetical protein
MVRHKSAMAIEFWYRASLPSHDGPYFTRLELEETGDTTSRHVIPDPLLEIIYKILQ